jgi:hypothetical protein
MTESEVAGLAEGVLRPELADRGYDRLAVRADLDSLADPALFIDVFLKPGSQQIGGQLSSLLHSRLSERLLELGEDRFPYLRVRYPDDEDPEEASSPGAH